MASWAILRTVLRVSEADPSSGLLLAITPPCLSARAPATERVHRGPDGVQPPAHDHHQPHPRPGLLRPRPRLRHRPPPPRPRHLQRRLPRFHGRRVPVHRRWHPGRAPLLLLPHRRLALQEGPQPAPALDLDVVSHAGKLWWVDAAAGLLACDPFADTPDMAYVPLPETRDDDPDGPSCACYYCSERMIASCRFVQLSDDRFRCVHITPARHGADPTVTMRMLANPDTAHGHWTLDYQVSFADIWAADTYKAAGLPDKEPVVALIHPTNPNVLYFFLDEYLFAVDVRAKKLIECEAHGIPSPAHVSPSYVLPCKLPPALTAAAAAAAAAAGFGGNDTDNAPTDAGETASST